MPQGAASRLDPGRERVDARFKGFAPALFGLTIADVASRREALFGGAFLPPLMVLREASLRGNIEAMARYVRDHGVEHAPHGKTTLAPRLFEMQLDSGAWGISVGTPSQVVLCRALGIRRVFLANELVDPAAIAWLGAELAADEDFEFLCYVDSVAGVRLLADHLAPSGSGRTWLRRFGLVVEVGSTNGRTGCRSVAEAVAVGRAAAEAHLPVRGVAGYEGGLGSRIDDETFGRVRAFLASMRETADALLANGLLDDPSHPILTAGGSVFFDEVVAAFEPPLTTGVRPRTIIRPGAYVSHDAGHYDRLSPFTRPGAIPGYALEPAIEAWAQVISVPEPGLALADLGRRDVSFDLGFPVPLRLRRPSTGAWLDAKGMTVTNLNDQHAFISVPPGSDPRVGDWVAFGISHPCTAFDKWHLIPIVDRDDVVVDLVRTYF